MFIQSLLVSSENRSIRTVRQACRPETYFNMNWTFSSTLWNVEEVDTGSG